LAPGRKPLGTAAAVHVGGWRQERQFPPARRIAPGPEAINPQNQTEAVGEVAAEVSADPDPSNEEFYRMYRQALEGYRRGEPADWPGNRTTMRAFIPAAVSPWFIAPFGP